MNSLRDLYRLIMHVSSLLSLVIRDSALGLFDTG